MSRPTGALEQKDWFAPSYRHACNVYEQSSPPPIASPIFPVAQGYNFHLAENEDRFKRLFPFHQKIRGDGACYFNSCITGILNQCVGNSELWKTVRKNLIDNGFINIAEAIGDENSTLTRQHVNSLLQVKGDNNIVRQLSEAVLPPQHQLFIENRQGQIRDIKDQIRILSAELQNLQTIITDPEDKNIKILQTQIQNQQAAIVKAEEDIKLYSTAKLANTYLESDVLPIISNLCGIPSENIVTLSSDIFPMLDDTSLSNQNKIYLWNPGGGAHFDLLYSNADTALAKEAEPLIKQAQKNIPPNPSDTEIEELKKLAIAQIEPYLSGHITKFKQLLKDIYQDGNNLDADKSRLIIELIEEDKKINTPPATRHDLRSININSVEKPLSTEDKISIATFALNSALKTIADNDDLERSDESDFIQSIKIFLELSKDPEVNLENRGFLMHAALRGKSNFIKPIFDAGEDFSKKDTIFMENTALMWAVANANNQFAYDLLLFSEKDPAANIAINYVSTHYTTTALHLAAAKGYTDKDSNGKDITVANHLLVEKMINLGANPNIQSEHGTPLDIAVARRDIEMIQAICSSKQIQLETIINAQQALKLTYQEATKKITSASQICKSIDKRSFEDQKIKGQIQEILDQTAQKIKPLNIEDINSNSNRKPTPTQHFIRKLEARLKTLKEGDLFTVELDMDGCFLNGRSPYGIDLKNPVNKELFDALKSIKEIAETKKAIFQVSICSTAGLKKFIDPNNPSADTTATRKKIFSKLHELNAEKQIHTDSTGAKTITTIYHDIIQTSYDGIDQIVTLWRKDSDDATNIEFKRNEGNVPNLFDSWNIDLRKNGELCKINALDFTLKLRIAAQEIKKLESHKTKPLKQIQRELISGVIPWNSDINDIVTSVGSDAAKNETESKNTIFVDNDPQYHEDIQPTSTATAFKRKTHLQHVINLCPRSTLVTQKDTLMTAVSSEDINKEFFKDDSDTKESSESIKAYKKHTQSIKYKGCNQFYHPHTRIKKSFPPNSTIGFANRITLNKELQTLLTNIRKKTATPPPKRDEELQYKISDLIKAINDSDSAEIEKILNKTPTLLNQKDRQGNTPLHIAAQKDNKDIVQLLLEKSDITAKNNDDKTASDIAHPAVKPLFTKKLSDKEEFVKKITSLITAAKDSEIKAELEKPENQSFFERFTAEEHIIFALLKQEPLLEASISYLIAQESNLFDIKNTNDQTILEYAQVLEGKKASEQQIKVNFLNEKKPKVIKGESKSKGKSESKSEHEEEEKKEKELEENLPPRPPNNWGFYAPTTHNKDQTLTIRPTRAIQEAIPQTPNPILETLTIVVPFNELNAYKAQYQGRLLDRQNRGNNLRVINGVYDNSKELIANTLVNILNLASTALSQNNLGDTVDPNNQMDQHKVIGLIKLAKKHNGLSKLDPNSKELSQIGVTKDQAHNFSILFQDLCAECGILTGREVRLKENLVGLRLPFISEEIIEKIGQDFDKTIKQSIDEIDLIIQKTTNALKEQNQPKIISPKTREQILFSSNNGRLQFIN